MFTILLVILVVLQAIVIFWLLSVYTQKVANDLPQTVSEPKAVGEFLQSNHRQVFGSVWRNHTSF
jgi:hypothetical protein